MGRLISSAALSLVLSRRRLSMAFPVLAMPLVEVAHAQEMRVQVRQDAVLWPTLEKPQYDPNKGVLQVRGPPGVIVELSVPKAELEALATLSDAERTQRLDGYQKELEEALFVAHLRASLAPSLPAAEFYLTTKAKEQPILGVVRDETPTEGPEKYGNLIAELAQGNATAAETFTAPSIPLTQAMARWNDKKFKDHYEREVRNANPKANPQALNGALDQSWEGTLQKFHAFKRRVIEQLRTQPFASVGDNTSNISVAITVQGIGSSKTTIRRYVAGLLQTKGIPVNTARSIARTTETAVQGKYNERLKQIQAIGSILSE